MFSSISLLLSFVVIVWLIGVSFLVFRLTAQFNRLTKGTTEKTLSEVLSEQLKQEKLTREELTKVLSETNGLRRESRQFLQKIGIFRYNPFSDTGGDQSFSLAILNNDDEGIILTSLFARTGVRWYVKTIKGGKGVEHELSKEEKEALKKAMK